VFLLRKVIGWQKFLDRRYPQSDGEEWVGGGENCHFPLKEARVPFLFKDRI